MTGGRGAGVLLCLPPSKRTASGSPGTPGHQAAQAPVTIRTQGAAGTGEGPNPAALNAEWTAYSDHSSCADWAGGDGVSAVSLNSSQIAWFFSDTYLGPAGPTIGFSRHSGFLHNSF